jgi:hypothetical protein
MTKRNTQLYAILLIGLGAPFIRAALADDPTLDDWKRAEAVDGCAGIPYQELARKCMDAMVDLPGACKEAQWSCDSISSLKGTEEDAVFRKRRADDLQGKLSSEPDEQRRKEMQAEIEKLREKAKDSEEHAKGIEKELALRKGIGEGCLKLRKTVQQIFKEAMDRADHDSGNFSPEIKAIYEKRKDKWKKEYESHEEGVGAVTKGIQKCQDNLDRRN